MIRRPWLVFDNLNSGNLEDIPQYGNVHIIDDSALSDGSGRPKYITVIDLTNLGGTITTIADLLAVPNQWLSLTTVERGGIAWSLGEDYVVGDTVTETSLSYLCTADHTALTGNVANGSPQQGNQTNWLMISSNVQIDEFTATGGQTVFSVPGAGYDAVLSVEINGSALAPSDFTPVSPNITLHVAALASDTVVITTMGALAVVNTYTKPEADAKFMQFETAGKAYDATVPYDLGDLVSYNGVVYENIIAIPTGEGWQAAKWATLDEKGGVVFKTTINYKVGDIVTKDNTATSKVYRCITDTTAGAMDPLEWNQLSEQGGVEYDATVYYNKGDMVTDTVAIPTKTYFAISAAVNVGNDPKANPSFWQELNSIFYNSTTGGDLNGDGILDLSDGTVPGDGGGQHCPWAIGTGGTLTTAWISGTTYNPGDEVSYSGWKYTSLVTTTTPTVAPDASAEWRLVSADGEPDLGNPNTLGEYPNTNVNLDNTEKIGASWLVSGLGFDDNGEKYKYTMTGGSLVGIDVKDGDQITWVDGATGSEIWFLSPAPEVTGERGGLLWASGKNYIIGDVVGGSDGKQYTAIWQSAGMDPVDQAANDWAWSCTTEGGGLEWDPTKTYSRGSIVSVTKTYPSGIKMVEQYLTVLDNTKGGDPLTDDGTNWTVYNVIKYIDNDITFTIGTGHDFKDIVEAGQYLRRFIPSNGAIITAEIQAGHIVDYPIVFDGLDLSEYILTFAGGGTLVFDPSSWIPATGVNVTQNLVASNGGGKFFTIKCNMDFNIAEVGQRLYSHCFSGTVSIGGSTININNNSSQWSFTRSNTGGVMENCTITAGAGSYCAVKGSCSFNSCNITGFLYGVATNGYVNLTTVRSAQTDAVGCRAEAGEVIAVWDSDLRVTGVESSNDCVVDDGGIISLWGTTLSGGSQTFNKLYRNGIIYKSNAPEAPGGWRNIIINGNLEINQRGFGGSWVNGDYAYDRWKGTATSMTQIIEDGSYAYSTVYTLSGTNITTQQLTSPAGGHWTLPIISRNARKIQLEEGMGATPFEVRPIGVELSLCQRYYYVWIPSANFSTIAIVSFFSTTKGYFSFPLPVSMRAIPTFSKAAVNKFRILSGTITDIIAEYGGSKELMGIALVGSFTAKDTGLLQSTSMDARLYFDAEL